MVNIKYWIIFNGVFEMQNSAQKAEKMRKNTADFEHEIFRVYHVIINHASAL